MHWKHWDIEKPAPGQRVVIVCNDGASACPALAIDFDGAGTIHALHGEDGFDLDATDVNFTRGAMWAPLPDDYPLAFTEARD